MAEQIGLSAVFDTSSFDKGLKSYTGGLKKAEGETDKAAGGMGKAWGQLGSSVTKTTAVLGGAVVGAAALAGAAIAKFTGDGISKAIELDQKMADIAAIMGKTREEIAPLNDLILNLGLDPTLKVSAVEAAAAIEMLGANGLDMTQIMEGAAKATVLLANATGADFDVAANIATDAMAIFNIEAADMIEAVNGITAVTVASKFGIDDYRLALAQGGGVAASAGVSFDDFNTSIAAISPLFASGSDAGTSFKTMINSLTPNSAAAATVMKQLGLEFYDASGQMKSMADISTELNDALFQEVTFSTEVTNATAEQVATRKMLEAQLKKTNMELYKYEVGINGVAQSEEDKIVSIDRLNRQHEAAVTAYQNLAIAQGTTITTTRTLTEEERSKALETIFGADATRAAIGIAEAGQVVYTDLAKAVAETGLAQELLTGYMKDGELTVFELTQAQMGLTDANAQASTRMDTVAGAMEIFSGTVETLQIQIGQAFLPVIKQMVEMFTGFVAQHAPAITAAFKQFAENVVALVNFIILLVEDGDALNDWLSNMDTPLKTVVMGIGALVVGVQLAADLVANSIGQFVAWKDILIVLGAAILYTVVPAIGVMLGAILPVIGVFALAIGAVAAVRLAWESDFLGIQTTVTAAISAITTAFEPLTTAISEFGGQALTEIWSFVTGNAIGFAAVGLIWEAAKLGASTLFTTIVGYVQTNLPVWTAALLEWGAAAWGWIAEAVATIPTKLGEWWGAISGYVAEKLPSWIAALLEWANKAWQWISLAVLLIPAKLGEWWTAISGYVTSQLPSWISKLGEWAAAAWQWIKDTVALIPAKLGEWWAALSGYVTGKLPEWKANFVEWATEAWQWIVTAAGQIPAKLRDWFAEITGWFERNKPVFDALFDNWSLSLYSWISSEDTKTKTGVAFDDWKDLGLMAKFKAFDLEFEIGQLEWKTELWQWITAAIPDTIKAASDWLIAWISGTNITKNPTAKTELDLAKEDNQTAWDEMMDTIGKALALAAGRVGQTIMQELGLGFLTEKDGIKTKFLEVLAEAVAATPLDDWYKAGQDLLNKIREGWESVRDAFYNGVTLFVARVKKLFDPEEWKAVGIDVLEWIQEGWESIEETFLLAVTGLIADIKKKFTDSVLAFQQLGKDIIDGVLTGLKANGQAVIDYISGLITDALGSVTSLLGIDSPSKVFAEIGVNIIQGLINGMQSMHNHLKSSVSGLVSGLVAGMAGNLLAGSRNMLTEFGKLSSDFMSAAGEWADAVRALAGDGTEDNPAEAVLEMFSAQQGVTDTLQRQLKLVELLRAAGRDPAQFLGAGGALGRNADPVMMMTLLTEATAAFNDQLENQLRIAARGYDTLINDLRSERQEIAQIEDLASRPSLRGIDFIRSQINDLDSQIAASEQNLLNTGHSIHAEQLRQLHTMRQMRAAELNDYIKLWNQVESTVEQAATFAESLTNEKGAEAARRFVDNHIRPLMDMIQSPNASMAQRNIWVAQINERKEALVLYSGALEKVTVLEEKFGTLTSDSNFGATITKNIQPFLDLLYDPMLSNEERNRIMFVLKGYQKGIAGVMSTFNRLGTHSAFGDLTRHLTPYLNQLLDVNLAESDRLRIMQDFNRINSRLQSAQSLDKMTVDLQERLDLITKIKALAAGIGSDSVIKYVLGDVDLMAGPLNADQWKGIILRYSEQAVTLAGKQLREALMPDLIKEFDKVVGSLRSFDQIMKEFDQTPVGDLERAQQYLDYYDGEIERLRALASAGHQYAVDQGKATKAARDNTVAWIRTYMDALVKADKHVARIQETTNERAADIATTFRENLIDPLRALMEQNIGADYRALLVTQIGQRVDQLNSYVRQVAGLSNLEKDIADALGFNPLVARFAEIRLDPLLQQIYDINTAEAERLRLVQLYRQEQEKIVALNQKVQQLEFLEMQLSLLDQITQLNEEFGEQVPLQDILSGIQFGVNANMDQMLSFVSKSLDAILRVTKEKLGIASPSKVFAKIGAQMMDGMTMGIQSSIMQPIGMLRSAISDIPYAMQGRSLAVNMGGVTINNGMDDVMFEARVRQIVQREFN